MKHIIFVCTILSLSLSSTAWGADDREPIQSVETNSTNKNEGSESLTTGPLLTERKVLLKEIEESKEKGIGIQTYVTAFQSIESMVQNNASEARIRARVESIRAALEDQLRLRQRSLESNRLPVPPVSPTEQTRPMMMMALGPARMYMLSLVNADREKCHRRRLALDTVATAAGQAHSDDMATAGYVAHWDRSGKKPWQRYSEAGGADDVSENLASVGMWDLPDGVKLANEPLFSPEDLQQMELGFMSEKPPYDNHRANILAPEHNKLGVGLSCAVNPAGLYRVCLAQEFVNEYGQYSRLPKMIVRGKPFHVSGFLFPTVKLFSVIIDWEPPPKPMCKADLQSTYSYGPHGETLMADISVLNEPESLRISTKGGRQQFSVQITPTKDWRPGLYHVEITAMLPGGKQPVAVSTRTVMLLN
ncbi:MAG TPA: CAP domain-containing protein [Trichormus sp.]|jgi:hypothetical protein